MMLKQTFHLILISLISSLIALPFAHTKTLNVLGMSNYPPFSFEQNGKMVGIDNEVMYEIGRRVGIEVEINYRPWKRLLADLKYGATDAAFALFWTQEREQFALYADVEPIHGGAFYLYVKEGDEFDFNNVSDLYNRKIGLQLAFSVSEDFDNAVKSQKINILNAFSNLNNIELLLAGRIEAFIGHELVTGYNLLNMGFLNQITRLPLPISEKKAFLVLSKESNTFVDKNALIKKINQALVDMKEDGTHQAIVNQYIQ
ncbi:bacterial extracellular solute-binding protein, family 3 [Marinomonas sp. MED121]|nr:bacterial extracellular solute-binding protein, family 3 [Marinomonas sp. MED121]